MYNHLILDIKLKEKITYLEAQKLLSKILNILNLTKLKEEKYVFNNWGFTLFLLLSESHISAHYRIEYDYLAIDIYSCNDISVKEKDIISLFKNLWEAKLTKINRITFLQ